MKYKVEYRGLWFLVYKVTYIPFSDETHIKCELVVNDETICTYGRYYKGNLPEFFVKEQAGNLCRDCVGDVIDDIIKRYGAFNHE